MSVLGGMSGPFSRRAEAHCSRCAGTVVATWPWPGWRRLRRVWLAIVFGLVVLSPLYLADIHGILPAVLVFVAGIGPLNALAAIAPTCLTCGAAVQPLPAAGDRGTGTDD